MVTTFILWQNSISSVHIVMMYKCGYTWLAPGSLQLQKGSTLEEESQLGGMSSNERLALGISKILPMRIARRQQRNRSFCLPLSLVQIWAPRSVILLSLNVCSGQKLSWSRDCKSRVPEAHIEWVKAPQGYLEIFFRVFCEGWALETGKNET